MDPDGTNPTVVFFTGGVVSAAGKAVGSTTGIEYGSSLMDECHEKVSWRGSCYFRLVALLLRAVRSQDSPNDDIVVVVKGKGSKKCGVFVAPLGPSWPCNLREGMEGGEGDRERVRESETKRERQTEIARDRQTGRDRDRQRERAGGKR